MKGISIRKNNKYEAYLSVKHGGKSKNASNKQFKIYIGVFNTREEAKQNRLKFIKGLI